MAEVTMPRLSDTMEKGTVARWLKRPGEQITKGEPLVEIETDKANMTLDAYESGVLERITVQEGQTVPIGEPIAYIASERSAAAGGPSPAPGAAVSPPAPPPVAPAQPARTVPAEGEEGRLKVSPIARRLAQEHEVDLAKVTGTGPGGRITKEDVESFIESTGKPRPREVEAKPAAPLAAPSLPEHVESVAMTRMQATIARRMAESKATVPHFYATSDVAMDAAMAFRKELNATIGAGEQVGLNDMLIRASMVALRKFPEVNASFQDGQIEYHESIDIGIAVALPKGLVVPVLRGAENKLLVTIAREARDLVTRARSGHLAPADWEGGTFTISNLGKYDVDEFAAIISPPQAAIMAVGSIRTVPVVADGQVTIGQRMKLTLSADHRVFYGAMAAEFLREVKRMLEQPLSLLL